MLQVTPPTPSPKANPRAHAKSASGVRRRMRLDGVSAELKERRRQHALAERQRNLRKEQEVVRMRAQLEALETHFSELQIRLSAQQAAVLQYAVNAREKMRKRYLDALVCSGRLRRERWYLQCQVHTLNLIVSAAETLLEDYGTTASPTERSVLFREHELHEKLHETRCVTMARQLYEETLRFKMGGSIVQFNINGWNGSRAVNGTEYSFSISKVFEGISAESVIDRTWPAAHDLSRGRRLFSATSELQVMQKVNNDMSIVRRTICHGPGGAESKCVNFIFRLKTSNGYIFCIRTLDEPSRKLISDDSTDAAGTVVDQFYWVELNELGHGRCRVTFAGRLDNGTIEYAVNRTTESHIAIMVWESEFVRPVFKFT